MEWRYHCRVNPLPPPCAVAKAVSAINKAVVEAGPGEVLAVLKSPAPAVRSLTDECAQSYQSKLREAVEEKKARGEGWGCLHCWEIVLRM